jgi:DNA-binding beta-propeller fold protein YncE
MKKFAVIIVPALVAVALAQDSLNCREKGSWPFGPLSYAVAHDASRNLAFLGSGGGVYVLDVSNPGQPVKLSEAIHTRGVVRGLCYSGNRLYIAAREAGLEIWDITNPAAPTRLGYCNTPSYAYGVAVSGNYAYVADGWAGLRIINVSNPQSPFEAGYYDTPGWALGVAVSGNYAYVADGGAGLRIINVSNPQSPFEAGYYDTPGWAYGVAVSGNYAYVADREAGLRIIEFYGAGVAETLNTEVRTPNRGPTIIRGVLNLGVDSGQYSAFRAELLDISGRKVMVLAPGVNDVRRLAPGVYFIREFSAFSEQRSELPGVRKVVVAR